MLDQQREVTSFKTRTHHGSGKKETYNLKACVYLEDPRPAGERSAADMPREMKLSLLRWDSPEPPQSQYRGNPPLPQQHKQIPCVGVGKAGVEREPEAGAGWKEDVAGARRRPSATVATGESDDAILYPMREEMWMMCNLDDNLFFSQFHSPAETEQAVLGTTNLASWVPIPAPPEPNGFAPSVAGKKIHGSAASTPLSGVPAGGPVVDPAGKRSRGDEDALLSSGWRGRSKPPPPPSVRRTRREERVTFHARPTCHDFLGGWVGGRARRNNSPYRSQETESKPESKTECQTESESASEGKNRGGRSGDGDKGKTTGVSSDRGGRVSRVVAIGFKSGDCAVLDATMMNSPSFLSVLNKGGACCEGRVTAIRFVPGEGQRLLLAAFSNGDAFLFDTSLAKEAPLGSAGEKSATATNGGTSRSGEAAGGSDGGSGGSKRRGSGVMRGSGSIGLGGQAKSGQDSAGGSNNATVGSVSSGSSGSWGRSRSSPEGTTRASNDSSTAPSLPASFVAGSRKDEQDGTSSAGGRNGRGSRGKESGNSSASERRFFVERNSVKEANPVCRWRVSSDRRDLTDMAFAPCEVDGRRLVALAALDGALRIVDFDDQALVAGFRSWFGGILCLDWSPDGRYIVAGGEDDAVTLWCLETRACVMRGEGHGSWVTDVAFDYWTSRPNYYRFTSVGEDARICMWEHDEMAGSLLRGGAAGRPLRGAPSANVQQRYRSSSEHQPGQRGVGETVLPAAGLSYPMKNASVVKDSSRSAEDSDRSAAALTSAVVSSLDAQTDKTPAATAAIPTATSTGGGYGGGRRPLTLPSRGVSFIGGVVRREFGGRSGVTAAGGAGGGGAAGGGKRGKSAGGVWGGLGSTVAEALATEEGVKDDVGRRSSDAGLMSPALSRQFVPKGEPLCCKRLSDVPLSQVMVVRAGVLTLCAEGLIKLWARPSIPPPLPPMPPPSVQLPLPPPLDAGQVGSSSGLSAARNKAAVALADDWRGDKSKSSSSSRIDRTVTITDDSPEVATDSTGQPIPATGSADGKVKVEASSDPASTLPPLPAPPAFDALINTDMHTPRGEGSAATDEAATDGTGKKKGFFRFFFGSDRDKSSGGRSGAGGGGVGAAAGAGRRDDGPLSALAIANAKAREPVEFNGQNLSSSTAVRSAPWLRGGGKIHGRGGASGGNTGSSAIGPSRKGGVGGLGRSSL